MGNDVTLSECNTNKFNLSTGLVSALIEGAKTDMEFFTYMIKEDYNELMANRDGEVYIHKDWQDEDNKTREYVLEGYASVIRFINNLIHELNEKFTQLKNEYSSIRDKFINQIQNNKEEIDAYVIKGWYSVKDWDWCSLLDAYMDTRRKSNIENLLYYYKNHSKEKFIEFLANGSDDDEQIKKNIFSLFFDGPTNVMAKDINWSNALVDRFEDHCKILDFLSREASILEDQYHKLSSAEFYDTNDLSILKDIIPLYRDIRLKQYKYIADAMVMQSKQVNAVMCAICTYISSKSEKFADSVASKVVEDIDDFFYN